MAVLNTQARRFDLVTSGHHFLLRVLPVREPESPLALTAFVAAAKQCRLPVADVDAVLIRCLAALSDHARGQLPSLVDRYVSGARLPAGIDETLARFSACVEDLFRHRGRGDSLAQSAIDTIYNRFADPALAPRTLARLTAVRLSTLCITFKRHTGMTLREYVRGVRLDRAAEMLLATDKSVKEVWVSVGYNHASNFDHDFKHRFQVTPREYRARRSAAIAREHPASCSQPPELSSHHSAARGKVVLLVDDDQFTTAMVTGYLQAEGFTVRSASTGRAALHEFALVRPDVVLLDHHLDDLDGVSVLRDMRRQHASASAAIAIFSADWELYDRVEELRRLNALLVSKLCDLDQLKRLVTFLSFDHRAPADMAL